MNTSDVFFGRAGVQYDSSRCVRTVNRFATCTRCVQECPTQAFLAGSPPAFDAQACRSCGLCLHICPNGAFSGEDGVKQLYDSVTQLHTATRIELVCHQHTTAASGAAGVDAVMRVDHCLAAFGPSVYLGLLGLAREGASSDAKPQISVRLDACATCPLGAAQPSIARTIAEANALAEASGHAQPFAVVDSVTTTAVKRPVLDARPQLSRRQLFTAVTGGGKRILSGSLIPEPLPKGSKTPPPERQRLIAALKVNPALTGVAPADWSFANLSADDQCSACGVCAKVCPTGALTFIKDRNDQYRLSFKSAACTACGICIDLCEPAALHRTGTPRLSELVAEATVTLREGQLRRCERCGTKFDGPVGVKNCPVCEWRKRHPFGSRPSPLNAKLMKTPSGE